jgi:hypothetical protein
VKNSFRRGVEKFRDQVLETMQNKAKDLEEKFTPIRDHHGGMGLACDILGVPRTTMRCALTASKRTSLQKQDELLALCIKHIEEGFPAQGASDNAEAKQTRNNTVPSQITPAQAGAVTEDRLEELEEAARFLQQLESGDLTTITQLVIKKESLVAFKLRMAGEMIQPMKTSAQMLKAWIELLLRSDDPELTESLRKQVLDELTELYYPLLKLLLIHDPDLAELAQQGRAVVQDLGFGTKTRKRRG